MPPSHFLQQSKTKMQAWVMNNNGHGANAKPPAPTGTHGYHNDVSESLQKGHVYHHQHQGQPNPAQSAAAPTHESSPPRTQYQSRMPIINANATNRAVAASAARIPSRTGTGRPGHSRDTSLNMPRSSRVISSEPLQPANAPKPPFWEGSTVDGSVFSDTASIADARAATQPTRMPFSESLIKPRNTPRQHPTKRESDGERLPFVIGDNGLIDVVKRGALTRSTSTPDARAGAGSKGVPQDSDSYAGDAQYQDSLDKTPPNTLNHHRARFPLRAAKRESFSERTSYPSAAHNGMSSPPDQAYQTPGTGLDYVPRADSDRLRIPDHGPHRSTMFENIDTPVASHPDSDVESFEEQQTPKPAAATKPAQPPVNRQLFSGSKGGKGQNSLRESSMPRPTPDKRQSTTKKRHFELDYDDGALAAMGYSELRKQAFDFDPARAESQSAQVPPPGTLPEKLDHFLDKDANAQANFFTTMSVRDWDDSGDWFLERFGEVMHRLRDARRAKRQLIDDFETEIAEREEAVRSKIHGIGQTLEELKSEGEILMKGKELD
jgi:hypothetical protein